jgi:membrane-bound inhibitor of C-type lysozyme
MDDPKDSLTFEILGFKASAVGRFAVTALLFFSLVLVASAAVYGPGQIVHWWRGGIETTGAIK